ncbi:MAG: OmpA family protein [Planctomycetes bacterium]|nr:OmpA family protein [Planctomycetota bacterium]
MHRTPGGGPWAAPFLFLAAAGLAAASAGCASDSAAADVIHSQDAVILSQRNAADQLRERLSAAEKALAAARVENDRLRGSDEAFRAAREALAARIKELEGSFPEPAPGGDAGVTVEGMEGGYKFVVQGEILFGLGDDALTDEGRQALARIAAALKGGRDRVRVEGHTDNVPIVKADTKARFPFGNLDLSLQRALVVADALVREGGLEAKRVSCAGYGEHAPRADNGTAEGRKRNRRVEILVQQE